MKRVISAALAAGLLTACAGLTGPGAVKSQTPQQALDSSAKAMSQLKSAHFDLNGTIKLNLPQQLVDQLRAKGGSQAAMLSANMSVILKVSGAAQRPDRLQATVSAKLGGLTLNTEVIAASGTLYYRDPLTSKWEPLKRPATPEPKPTAPTTSAPKLSYQTLLDTAKSVTEVTDPSSSLNGVTVEHYRIVPDLARLFGEMSASHSSIDPAAIGALQTVLEDATVSADVWTGASDHLIRRLGYDLDVSADLSQMLAGMKPEKASTKAPALSLPAGSIGHLTAHLNLDLHDFNTRLTIQAPAVGS